MPRSPAFSNERFLQAWNAHKDVKKVCKLLNVSYVTVYKYIKQNNILTPRSTDFGKRTEAIDKAYVGNMNVVTMAKAFGVVPSDIRYHLKKAIAHKWTSKKFSRSYPKPKKLVEYRIVKELERKPELFDNPEEIASIVDCDEVHVVGYLTRVFKHRSKYADNNMQ